MINTIKSSRDQKRLGIAWLLLTSAFAVHVFDEAVTGFLGIYNPTVLVLRAKYSWFAMPIFDFREFLTTMICAVAVLFALSPLFFDNVRWIRPLGYFAAVVQILNAFGHVIGTVLGRTVESVHFSRPAPGFSSSPFLLIALAYLLYALAQSRVQPAATNAAVSG